ncbi:hypothetical protein [Modestobacter italicus]|uniref:hypothetical protein n=1 Tax=Modestobacter italicus (strain DSM 44449 / CECT 9708 / BC 501) TaxID=2732864 RepID=UPI001C96EFE4|nr:hypothetical protein [Modestobacter italicus]
MSRGGGWLLAASVCAAGALGLSWSGQLAGAAHPARVLVVAAVLLTVVGWQRGRDQLLTAALAAAGVGVLLGGLDASPGRLALGAAAACLVLAGRAAGRRVLPRRTAA